MSKQCVVIGVIPRLPMLVAGVAATVVLWYAMEPLATRARHGSVSPGMLVRHLLLTGSVGTDGRDKWSEQDVWYVLREIIVDSLRISPDMVSKDARFYQDLGAG